MLEVSRTWDICQGSLVTEIDLAQERGHMSLDEKDHWDRDDQVPLDNTSHLNLSWILVKNLIFSLF